MHHLALLKAWIKYHWLANSPGDAAYPEEEAQAVAVDYIAGRGDAPYTRVMEEIEAIRAESQRMAKQS